MQNIQIYSTRQCSFCHNAKALLKFRGLAFEEVDVTEDNRQRQQMMQRSGKRTVPQVFINGVSVGGFSELAQMDAAGQLG